MATSFTGTGHAGWRPGACWTGSLPPAARQCGRSSPTLATDRLSARNSRWTGWPWATLPGGTRDKLLKANRTPSETYIAAVKWIEDVAAELQTSGEVPEPSPQAAASVQASASQG